MLVNCIAGSCVTTIVDCTVHLQTHKIIMYDSANLHRRGLTKSAVCKCGQLQTSPLVIIWALLKMSRENGGKHINQTVTNNTTHNSITTTLVQNLHKNKYFLDRRLKALKLAELMRSTFSELRSH